MTAASQLWIRGLKEGRALLPAWIGSIAVGAIALLDPARLYVFTALAYGLGSLALGAVSMGHEYTNRTFGLLLSQPSSRAQLLLVKFAVLLAALASLGVLVSTTLLHPAPLHWTVAQYWSDRSVTILWLSLLCGLCIAPLLTMLCRSALAGVVFTVFVPALVWLTTDLLAIAKYGLAPISPRELESFRFAAFSKGTAGFCAVAAFLTWRTFARLEVIEGRDPDVRLPDWLRRRTIDPASTVRMQHPIWLLMKKELRLQQMAFVVAGSYLLGWAAITAIQQFVPGFIKVPAAVVGIPYGGLLAVLIGSLASAEERQFGTLETQALLPIATWKQWTVKAGTALGLSLLLSFGLPVLLAAPHLNVTVWHAAAMIGVTAGSLYVSSLSANGLGAFLLSLPAVVGGTVFGLVGYVLSSSMLPHAARSRLTAGRPAVFPSLAIALLAVGVTALVLRFALENHRSSDRGAARVWRQLGWIAGSLAAAVVLLAAVTS